MCCILFLFCVCILLRFWFTKVATGDDFGKLNIFNFPCVASKAPSLSLTGHSSHVTNVKFLHTTNASEATSYGDLDGSKPMTVVTTGGNDCSAMVWSIRPRR